MKKLKNLDLEHIEQRLNSLKNQDLVARPPRGWIKFIREALNMSSKALAKRVGISPNTMSETEKAEIEEAITLRKLKRVADSLNCDLVYYFLPRKPIHKMLDDRLRYITEQKIRNSNLEMSEEEIENLIQKEVDELLYSKKMWDDL